MAIFCRKCGKEQPNEGKYCCFCGNEIEMQAIPIQEKFRSPNTVKVSDKIQAIKEYRERTGVGLAEAKYAIENPEKYQSTLSNSNTEQEKNNTFVCPRCGSSDVSRVETGNNNLSRFWFLVLIVSALGGSVSPIILVIGVIGSIICFIVNRVEKARDKSTWSMKCIRCLNEFSARALK